MLILILVSSSCTPRLQIINDQDIGAAAVADFGSSYRTRDGRELALNSWGPAEEPRAVVLALHGMNEHSKVLNAPAQIWARDHIRTIAYDQRGFGADQQRGIWAGWEILARDVCDLMALIQERYKGRNIPLFIIGESMGAAVATTALAHFKASTCAENKDTSAGCWPGVSGVVLVSPAVAGRKSMPFLVRPTTWLLAHSIPWVPFPVDRKLWLIPDIYDMLDWDDEEIREEYVDDPLFLGSTRFDAIWGLFELMDAAQEAAPRLVCPKLILFGARDEVISTRSAIEFLNKLPADSWQLAVYEDGCHNLLAGRKEHHIPSDIAAWMLHPNPPDMHELPSGRRFTDDAAQIELGSKRCKDG